MQISSNSNSPAERESSRQDVVLRPRQLECLYWAQQGKSAGDIGQIIGLSGRTVEGHLAKACAALGVRTRVQAVLQAHRLGLLGPAGP